MYDLHSFYGPNAGYVLDLYERYLQDPASVDADTQELFANWSPAEAQQSLAPAPIQSSPVAPISTSPVVGPGTLSEHDVDLIIKTSALTHAIRERGHLGAHLDPLDSEPMGDPALLLESYGLMEEDLLRLPADIVGGHSAEGAANALEAIQALRAMYSGTISYEFDQVKSPEERSEVAETFDAG
jgi:2-oxoglutarate dehydrogenase E1 component